MSFIVKLRLIFIALFLNALLISAQKAETGGSVKVVGETPSTPGYILEDVIVTADNSDYQRKYKNAKYFIRRVYAYSELAAEMLNEYKDTLLTIESNRNQKKFLKQANKELKDEFGDEIKEMSVTRGEYLNKLIYRKTGLSTYDIIKNYRGNMNAMFWQSLCRVNGQNLKVEYDAEGEDALIEKIVQEIEAGKIKVIPRPAKSEKGKEIEKRNKKNRKNKIKKISKEKAVASH